MLSDYLDEDHAFDPKAGPLSRRRVVVTGAAGFIGSHLVDRLLADGCEVIGIDNFDPWYSPEVKRANLNSAGGSGRFTLHESDLTVDRVDELFAGADVVFHLAARPGVQDSWGAGFADACQLNIGVTQAVLEAALAAKVRRVVYASSSSVYGEASPDGPRPIAPISPYGVSKAAGEQLANVYGGRGLDVVSLRYFTVFGPRQRPDMAMHRLFAAAERLDPDPFPRRGSGEQQREFTYVGDVVRATAAAGLCPSPTLAGRTFDVGGGCTASLNEVIATVGQVVGRDPIIVDRPMPPGDPTRTAADLGPIGEALGWQPTTSLRCGLIEQWAWQGGETMAPTALRSSADEHRGSRVRTSHRAQVDVVGGSAAVSAMLRAAKIERETVGIAHSVSVDFVHAAGGARKRVAARDAVLQARVAAVNVDAQNAAQCRFDVLTVTNGAV